MRKLQPRRGRSLVYSWPVFFALAVAMVFAGRAALNAYRGLQAAETSYAEARASREKLEAASDALAGQLEKLSNPYGLEKELRERYSLRKPGEEVVIFTTRPNETAPPASDAAPMSWMERLRAFIPQL